MHGMSILHVNSGFNTNLGPTAAVESQSMKAYLNGLVGKHTETHMLSFLKLSLQEQSLAAPQKKLWSARITTLAQAQAALA